MPQPKMKYAEVKILPHHLPYLNSSKENGSVNILNSLWLAAFAVYNTENALKLSPEYHASYETVYKFISNKLK